jgi:hypothetical protein
VNDPFETVSQAIDAAINGDTIILMPGVYSGSANRPVVCISYRLNLYASSKMKD